MTKTQNYQLNQWESTDKISRGDFNSDNAKLDAALAAKAEKSSVTALETALASYKTQNEASLAALSSAVGTGGQNARITWGVYKGTGTYGKDNPCSLTFDFCPVAILIACPSFANNPSLPSVYLRDCAKAFPNSSETTGVTVNLTWSDNGVSWYNSSSSTYQNNTVSLYYYYVAIGCNTAE